MATLTACATVVAASAPLTFSLSSATAASTPCSFSCSLSPRSFKRFPVIRCVGTRQLSVVYMAPEEEKMTRRSPLDFPIEWERPKPGRRPDIFPQFSPMKTPLPPPLPADPPEEDEEEEEKKEEEEEDPDKEDPENPEK